MTLKGLAQVRDDGRLVVDGRDVALYGIEIPLFERNCRSSISPVRCAPQAVLILDSIVEGFVHCEPIGRYRIGQLIRAVCTIRGERMADPRIDIGAEMLLQGWAFTAANAPSRYRSLERLAQSRETGMWSPALAINR